MDMHPTGFPGLVGPEGSSGFNHSDLSSHFRFLPNTTSSDLSSAHHDSVSLRSLLPPPQLHASPAPIPSPLPHPLRLPDDVTGSNSSKSGSPRLASPPSQQLHHHLLPHDSAPLLASPRYSPKSKPASPARLLTAENVLNDADLVLPSESSQDVPVLQEM